MLFPRKLFERARCSEKEKATLVSTVRTVVALDLKVEREGLLALESNVEGSESFLAQGLREIISGTAGQTFEADLFACLVSCDLKGVALLERMIVAEGLMGINEGWNPETMKLRLLAYLGDSFFFAAMRAERQ